MAQSIRVSKLMRFGIKIAKKQSIERSWHSPSLKDADYINFIVSDWLRQNYTQKELFDMGYDEVFVNDL